MVCSYRTYISITHNATKASEFFYGLLPAAGEKLSPYRSPLRNIFAASSFERRFMQQADQPTITATQQFG